MCKQVARYIAILGCLILGCSYSLAQELVSFEGRVTDKSETPLSGVEILLDGVSRAQTGTDGKYKVDIPSGTYNLIISTPGFRIFDKQIEINADNSGGNDFVMTQEVQTLADVVVSGKSEAQILREEAFAVETVEMEGFKNLATNGNDILSKVSGVNIRQSGGVGSEFTLSLNGLSGNQIRLFLDGVPMDYFGSSLALNNFSANLLDRIEVYKGVAPIHLSSDALGGAINIVTDQSVNSFLDASYAIGSYDTRIASVNGQYRNENNGFTTKLMSFYNFSENNYKVPIKLIEFDEFGIGTQDDFYTDVEHFHDAYESKMLWLQTGFTRTDFADQLLVGAMYSENYDEVQQPPFSAGEPAVPYGEVLEEEEKFITNLSYRKSGLFDDKFNLDTYLVGVNAETTNKDISSLQYDWFGNGVEKNNTVEGEIESRKTLFTLDVDNYLGRINGEYVLDDKNNLAMNYSFNHLKAQGSDKYKQQNETQFRYPTKVKKDVAAIAYTNASMDDTFKNSVFGKFYSYKIDSLETDYQGDEVTPFEKRKSYTGFGFTSTLFLGDFQLKASYERATRFPEFIELFGDGLNIVPNPTLSPEESDNYNLGFIYSSKVFENPLSLSVNAFVRDAKNFIIPFTFGIKTRYENYVSVTAKGVDLSANYMLGENWILALNGSYLDKRDNDVVINGDKARVPNEPYLFGNLSLTYTNWGLFNDYDSFAVTASQNYVHEFFYRWEEIGQDKGVVPEQSTTDLEFVYSSKDEKFNYSLGIVNLWDADVYDNFQQLRPGRTFNFKFRYFMN